MGRLVRTTAGLGMVAALTLTGCSTKASDGGGDSGSGLKTDIGVTDSEINLLEIEDLSGPFRVQSLAYTFGIKIWAEEVNEAGGICERDIVVNVKDSNYKTDLALSLYEAEKGNSLGMVSLVGSPMLAALKTKIDADKMLTVPGSWASVNLDSDAILMIGQTYDVEMLNGLAYLQQQGLIADGDKIGHIYVDSEYGQNGFLGSKEYAKNHEMDLVEAKISATDTDMTATITKLKADGVKAIALSVPPAATGSVALQNQSQGLNVPLVGSNPAYAPTLLTDSGVEAALENFYLVQSTAPVSADIEKSKELLDTYKGMSQDPPNIGTNMAYVWGLTYGEVLKTACEDGDMTRQGLIDARKKVTSVTSDGLMGEQDLSDPGAPSTREAYILKADKNAEGGLSIVEDLYVSEDAENYKAPYQK